MSLFTEPRQIKHQFAARTLQIMFKTVPTRIFFTSTSSVANFVPTKPLYVYLDFASTSYFGVY